MLSRFIRLARMSAVRASGEVLRMGSEKLIVFPVMLGVLGVHDTGRVLIGLAWTRAVLAFPPAAVNIGLLRMHADSDRRRGWPDLLTAGLGSGVGSAVALGLLAWAGWMTLVPAGHGAGYGPLLLALGLATLIAEVRRLATADMRLQLRFGRVSSLEALEGILLLAAIPLARRFGVTGLVTALLLAPIPSTLWTLWLTRHTLLRTTRSWIEWLNPLAKVSLGFAGVTAIGQLQYQLARLVLGAAKGPDAVAAFFAAEASVVLLLMPVHYLSTVLLTLLARKGTREEIAPGVIRQHAIGTMAAAALLCAAALVVCPWVVRVLYRGVADAALSVVGVLAAGAAFRLLFMSALPFYYRFARMSTILTLSLSSLVVSGALIVTLTLTLGLRGAALGVTLGNVFTGLLWFGIHVFAVSRGRPLPR